MDKAAYEARREQWWQSVTNCAESGMKKSEWCRQNGINPRTLYYWQRRFRDELASVGKQDALPEVYEKDPAAKPGIAGEAVFVDLTDHLVPSHCPQSGSGEVGIQEAFLPQLMIRSGLWQVYVGSTVQETTLETVLRVLSHA